MVRSVARYASFVALAWLLLSPLVAVWGIGVANNPNSPNAITVQGPDPTGNQGYPVAVVGATGCPLDVNVTGFNSSPCVTQCTNPWVVAGNKDSISGFNLLTPVHNVIQATALCAMFSNEGDNQYFDLHGARADCQRTDTRHSLRVVNQVSNFQTGLSGGVLDALTMADAATANPLIPGGQSGHMPTVAGYLYRGTNVGFDYDRQRTPVIFKSVQANAAGNTALWTPAAGTKFRLMRYRVEVTGNATLAAGAVLTIKLLDAAADTNQTSDSFVPGAAVSTQGCQYQSGWIDLGNGLLSAAANNVLNVNLSAALTAGNVRVDAIGTEE